MFFLQDRPVQPRISLMNRAEARMTMITNRPTPPSGFITSQLMIGVITYAVISRAAKKMIARSKSIVNINLT